MKLRSYVSSLCLDLDRNPIIRSGLVQNVQSLESVRGSSSGYRVPRVPRVDMAGLGAKRSAFSRRAIAIPTANVNSATD